VSQFVKGLLRGERGDMKTGCKWRRKKDTNTSKKKETLVIFLKKEKITLTLHYRPQIFGAQGRQMLHHAQGHFLLGHNRSLVYHLHIGSKIITQVS
jgi:hypothetical protein